MTCSTGACGGAGRIGAVAAALALALALAAPGAANAQRIDLPDPVGNRTGGQPFRHECAPGFYLVGLNVRDGAWIEAIGAVCQRWNPATQRFEGEDQTFDVAGGPGGGPGVIRCQPNAAIANATGSQGLNDDRSVAQLIIRCRRVDMPDQANQTPQAGREVFGQEHKHSATAIFAPFTAPPTRFDCPPGFWSVGIFGRAGIYIDLFGLICGKGPAPAAAPAAPPPAPPRVPPPLQGTGPRVMPVQPVVPRPNPGGVPSLNPAVRRLGCPPGTQPRTDDKGALVCVRPQ